MKYFGYAALILATSLSIQNDSFAQKKKKKKKRKEKKTQSIQKEARKELLTKVDTFNSQRHLIDGMKFYMLQDYGTAIPFFKSAINDDKNNSAAYHQIAKCFIELDKLEDATTYALKALDKDPKNYFYYEHLNLIYRKRQLWDKSITALESTITSFPKKWDNYELLANIYLSQKKYKEAIKVYDDLEQKKGVSTNLIRRKQQLYLQINDKKGAINEAKKLVEAFPDDVQYNLFYSEMLVIDKQYDVAKQRLLTLEKKDKENTHPNTFLLLAEIYDNTHQDDLYLEYMQKAFASKTLSRRKKIEILNNYSQKKDDEKLFNEGISLAKTAVEVDSSSSKLNVIYAQYLFQKKKYDVARTYYLNALKKDENDYDSWKSVLFIDDMIEDGKSLIDHADQALELYPNQPHLWLYKGKGHQAIDEYEEAISSLKQGKNLSSDNTLLTQFHEILGDALYKSGKKDLALIKWKKALELAKTPSKNLKKKVNTGEYSE